MLTIRTAAHIRGARNVKGFRSCHASTGISGPDLEPQRQMRSEADRATRELRRRWLTQHWGAHQMRVRAHQHGSLLEAMLSTGANLKEIGR